MGLGTVGQAFLQALEDNQDKVVRRVQDTVEVSRILVRHPDRHQEQAERVTTDPATILNDPEIRVVVEVMGGMEPARSLMLEALHRGKAVVTANKEVLAESGPELWAAAESGGADLLYEASVAAGIPIIQGIQKGLAANRINSVSGIVNGTTNYILTRMTVDGIDFETALRAAQAAGFAEADPTDDIDGHDAARKAAILASIAFGGHVTPKHVDVQGIREVVPEDIAYGQSQGWDLKLLASAYQEADQLAVWVAPTFIPHDHPLAGVSGAFNAVLVAAEPVGDVMFFGLGAGGRPTASAILGDVIEACANIRLGVPGFRPPASHHLPFQHPEDVRLAAYWRLKVVDQPGTLAHVANALAHTGVSLASVQQRPLPGGQAALVLVTHPCRLGALRQAIANVESLPVTLSMGRPIRVEGVD